MISHLASLLIFNLSENPKKVEADSDRLLDPEHWISTLKFELNFEFQYWQFGSMLTRFVNVESIEKFPLIQHWQKYIKIPMISHLASLLIISSIKPIYGSKCQAFKWSAYINTDPLWTVQNKQFNSMCWTFIGTWKQRKGLETEGDLMGLNILIKILNEV